MFSRTNSVKRIGADLRQWAELQAKLELANIDWSAPTLIIAECVLIYMAVSQSEELLANITKHFTNICRTSITNVGDDFGRVMAANLEKRGLKLPGMPACESLDTQKERLIKAGFTNGTIESMHTVFQKRMPPQERKRVLAIEHLDEMELLQQLNEHYSISMAVKTAAEKHYGLPSF